MHVRSFLAAVLGAVLIAPGSPAQDGDWQRRKEEAARYFAEAFRPGTAPPAEPSGSGPEPAPPGDVADPEAIRRGIVRLFEAYEREDAAAFLALLAPGFSAADRSGNEYGLADMSRALGDDFAALEGIRFTVFVGQPAVQRDGRRAQADVRWSRQTVVQVGGVEWILTDQRTTFVLDRVGAEFRLGRIFGDAIFGLARRSGRILVRDGTLDGRRVTEPVEIDRTAGIVAVEPTPSSGQPAAPSGSNVLTGTAQFSGGYLEFDGQTLVDCTATMPGGTDISFNCATAMITPANGAGHRELAANSFSDLAQAPPGGYSGAAILLSNSAADVGRTFVVETSNRKYGAYEISAFDGVKYTLRFKYQPDGSRNLK